MPRSALTPLLALVLAVPLVAHAGPKEDAQAHIGKAMEAHEKNNFEVAAKELELAYGLDPNPDLLYAIGQVYVKLKRCPEAITYYKRYLDSNPPAQAMADTKEAIKLCEKPEPPADPVPPPAVVAPTTQPSAWYKDPIGGALVGVGVVSAVIGIVLYTGARSDLDAAEDAPSLAEYDDLVDQAKSGRTYSVLFLGGGVVLIGAGVARYMMRRGDAREAQRVGLVPIDHGGLVTFGGSF